MRNSVNRTGVRDIAIIGRFPPPIDGQTVATRRLATLLETGYSVHRINTSAPEGEEVAAEVKFRPERVRYYLRQFPEMRRVLKGVPEAPVLWTTLSPARLGHWRDLLATLPALQPSQRVFGVLHRGTFHLLFQSSVTAPTARYLVRKLDGFVFLNDALSEACSPWIPAGKRFVIPNTIEDGMLCSPEEVASKQVDRSHREQLRLLFLSNMMPEKGYMDVLDAIRLLRNRNVPFHAVFAGRWVDEENRAEFECFVEEHNLQDRVEHRGSIQDRDIIRRMHLESDVFLLPSFHPTEAQPLALLEALNAATPTITTKHGGLPWIVRDEKETLFVPIRNPEAIARAVERLMDFAFWKRLSEGARSRFEEQYSPDAVRHKWEKLVDQ